jgi:hypothetical protein
MSCENFFQNREEEKEQRRKGRRKGSLGYQERETQALLLSQTLPVWYLMISAWLGKAAVSSW